MAQPPVIALMNCLGVWNVSGGRRRAASSRHVEVRDGRVKVANLAPLWLE
jgi:hypothetical protein